MISAAEARDENPVALASRRHAEVRAWAQGVGPVMWTPASDTGTAETDPSVVLAIIGALYAGRWLNIATSWDGESLRGGAGLLHRLASADARPVNKDDLVLTCDAKRGALHASPSQGKLGFWAGRISAARIWTTNAEIIGHADRPLDEPVFDGASATGYDEEAVGDSMRDGFSLSFHDSIQRGARPGRELLSYLGAAWLGSRRRGVRAMGEGRLIMPRLADVPIADMADLARAWERGDLVEARVDSVGDYRRVLRGGCFLERVSHQTTTWRAALQARARERLDDLSEVEEELADADALKPRDLRRRLKRARKLVGAKKPVLERGRPSKVAPTIGAALIRIERRVAVAVERIEKVRRAEARVGTPALVD